MALRNLGIHTITKNCGNILSQKIVTDRITATIVAELLKELKTKRLFNISNELIPSIKEIFEINEWLIIKLNFSKHHKCCLD